MRGHLLGFAALVTGLILTAAGSSAGQDEAAPEYPKVGSTVPGPFHVLNYNGDRKGRYHCLICRNSTRPVAAILARLRSGADDGLKQLEPGEPLAKLIKALDAINDKNPDAYLGTFAVFVGEQEKGATEDDQEAVRAKLEALTKEAGLKQFVFGWDGKTESKNYFADPKDDGSKGLKWGEPGIRVLLYNNHKILEAHDFTKDKPLTDKDAEAIAASYAKLVPPPFINRKKPKPDY
ncbi:MAG: hypothetical protein JNM56_05895 [Planctomycetia bacterium]|nr:hypothetical protein [Planctomycetia bacterium]